MHVHYLYFNNSHFYFSLHVNRNDICNRHIVNDKLLYFLQDHVDSETIGATNKLL